MPRPDFAPQPLGPWPKGVDNVARETEGAGDALREAVNVDLSNAGWPMRRRGTTPRVAATRAHSLFKTDHHFLAWVDGDLRAYVREPDGALTVVAIPRNDLSPRYLTYASFNDDTYWSDGIALRRLGADLVDHPATIAPPRAPFCTGTTTGGLAAGEYLVALTWRDAAGRESAPSDPSVVDVAAGGGIAITGVETDPPEDAATLHVYLSPANCEPEALVLYHARELVAGVSAIAVGAHRAGAALQTLWHVPMPAGHLIRAWNGRLLVGNGAHLCWSPGLRPAVMHRDAALRFGERLTLLEAPGEGLASPGIFVADHKRTYFCSGATPDTWQKRIVYPHAAVPGTSCTVPGNAFGLPSPVPVVAWLAANGVFCLGLPDGSVQPITDGRLVLSPDTERGAAVYREFDGLRQLLTTFLNAGGTHAGFSDSSTATIRRNGVTVD